MKPDQRLEVIELGALLEKVRAVHTQGARLVQICATTLPGQFELTYSFDLNDWLESYRVLVPAEVPRVPSISAIYGCAVLYENEMYDLFNIKVEGMTVDFHGHLYETTVKFAFGQVKAPCAKPQPAAAPPQI